MHARYGHVPLSVRPSLTKTEFPPELDSPYESKRRGRSPRPIEKVGDLIDLLLPYRDRKLFVDIAEDEFMVVTDLIHDGNDAVILDFIDQEDAESDSVLDSEWIDRQ